MDEALWDSLAFVIFRLILHPTRLLIPKITFLEEPSTLTRLALRQVALLAAKGPFYR